MMNDKSLSQCILEKVPKDLQKYIGLNLPITGFRRKLAADRERDVGIIRWSDQRAVEVEMKKEHILLCPDTVDYIYSEFTPLEVKYQRGSRPHLEKIVNEVLVGCQTDQDKVLALLRYVRDIRDRVPHGEDSDRSPCATAPFSGGTEEEIIKNGTMLCSNLSRVLITMAQIAGFPSRFVGHNGYYDEQMNYSGGHAVTEIYLNGAWRYFDIRGKFFVKADGEIANTWEIHLNPTMIDHQPEWVQKEIRVGYTYGALRECTRTWFYKHTVTTFANYFVQDHAHYFYPWEWISSEWREREKNFNETRYQSDLAKWEKQKGIPEEEWVPVTQEA